MAELKFTVHSIKVPHKPKLKHLLVDAQTKQMYRDMIYNIGVKEPRVLTNHVKVQVGTERVQVGTERVQTGTKSVPVYGLNGILQIKYTGRSAGSYSQYYIRNTSSFILTITDSDGKAWLIYPSQSSAGDNIVPSNFRDPCSIRINDTSFGSYNMVAGQNINKTWDLATVPSGYRQEPVYTDQPIYEDRPVYEEKEELDKRLLLYIRRK